MSVENIATASSSAEALREFLRSCCRFNILIPQESRERVIDHAVLLVELALSADNPKACVLHFGDHNTDPTNLVTAFRAHNDSLPLNYTEWLTDSYTQLEVLGSGPLFHLDPPNPSMLKNLTWLRAEGYMLPLVVSRRSLTLGGNPLWVMSTN